MGAWRFRDAGGDGGAAADGLKWDAWALLGWMVVFIQPQRYDSTQHGLTGPFLSRTAFEG